MRRIFIRVEPKSPTHSGKVEHDGVDRRSRKTTNPTEPGVKGILTALYPHQWKYSGNTLSDLTYPSVRGKLKLTACERFSTTVPIHGVLPMLPATGIRDQDRMRAYLMEEAGKPPADFADTYWDGNFSVASPPSAELPGWRARRISGKFSQTRSSAG